MASTFGLTNGRTWDERGTARKVVGIVENPQSLLDKFALVAPGQPVSATQATVLFDGNGVDVAALGSNYQSAASVAARNGFGPQTIVLALATLGLLLIALVAVGGFTVLAQRRLRSLGMLGALGATAKNAALAVRANGLVVAVMGTITGVLVGLAGWLAYRPHAEASAHHVIGVLALPWPVIIAAMVLAWSIRPFRR